MKRGLKGPHLFDAGDDPGGSRDFPDEEGTERIYVYNVSAATAFVPETSPMKRGLKACPRSPSRLALLCSRDFPDEEGTERMFRRSEAWVNERVPETSPMKRGLKGSLGNRLGDGLGGFQRLPR